MNIIVREAEARDLDSILGLIDCLKQFESQFDEHYKTDKKSIVELYESIRSNGSVFVAEVEGRIIGFIAMEISNKNNELIEERVPVAYISDMVVFPEYRNKGVGKKLFQLAEGWARNKELRYLKLNVFSDNKNARRAYLNFGFEDYENIMLKDLVGK